MPSCGSARGGRIFPTRSLRMRTLCARDFLVWKLTGNFYTDYSNASRTQLFNIHSLQWDEELCRLFGVNMALLPQVLDSDGVFGMTDMGGLFPEKVPVCGVLGDSHAALFAEGCFAAGQGKVTYGTGSSVMMNVGEKPVESRHGLASSLAWKIGGKVQHVLEGNINYSCAVITWLKDDLGLISDAKEVGALAAQANPQDETILIPAFSGLSAPYWKPEAKASILNMTRTTGKREICRAAEESIAFQIADIVDALRADTGLEISELRADGGATGDKFLMQTQADAAGASVLASCERELSPLGAGVLAGIAAGVYGEDVLKGEVRRFAPRENARVTAARARWKNCLKQL